MVAYVTLITATVGITAHTAFDIYISGSSEDVGAKIEFIINMTSLTTAIDILIHITALQFDVGSTTDNSITTITATVGITAHITTLHDMDIGLVVTRPHICIFSIGQDVVGVCSVIYSR